MSSFHTDEYVNFLHKVTPETAEKMSNNGQRCESLHIFLGARGSSSISSWTTRYLFLFQLGVVIIDVEFN